MCPSMLAGVRPPGHPAPQSEPTDGHGRRSTWRPAPPREAGGRWAARGGRPCSTSDREWRQSQDEPCDRRVNKSKNAESQKAADEQDEHEDQHDGLPIAVDPEEELRESPPEDGRQEAVAIEGRDGNQVKDRQDDVKGQSHLDHAPAWGGGVKAAGEKPELDRYGQEERDHQVGHRACQGHQGSVERAAHPSRIDPYRFRPAEADQEDRDGAKRVEVMAGVQRQASVESRRLVATGYRDGGMCELVPDQSDK